MSVDACTGLGPILPLRPEDIVVPVNADSELARALADRREQLLSEYEWCTTGLHPGRAAPWIAALHLGLVLNAVDNEDPFLASFAPDELGVSSTAGAHRALHALTAGGVVLGRASRFDGLLADLVDDVAAVHGAPAEAYLVSGTLPAHTGPAVGYPLSVVCAAQGPASVIDAKDRTTALVPGDLAVVEHLSSVATARDGLALVIGISPMQQEFVWSYLANKAAYWPRLRADLPYDLHEPAVIYGADEPADLGELVISQVRELESAETMSGAEAAYRAAIRPASRPLAGVYCAAPDLEGWYRASVRGRLPGGIGRLQSHHDGTEILAFAGCAVFVSDHLRPLLVALTSGRVVRVTDLTVECPSEDGGCVGRALDSLHPLGVVEVVDGPLEVGPCDDVPTAAPSESRIDG